MQQHEHTLAYDQAMAILRTARTGGDEPPPPLGCDRCHWTGLCDGPDSPRTGLQVACPCTESRARVRGLSGAASRLPLLSRLGSRDTVGKRFSKRFGELKTLPDQVHAVAALRAWIVDPGALLALIGPAGTGKTLLAMAALWAAADAETHQPVYVPVGDALQWLQTAPRDEAAAAIDRWMAADLVLLDDLGVQVKAGYKGEDAALALYAIINHRYAMQLPTIITTNLALGDLDERLRSRLEDEDDSRIIVMPGASVRTHGADRMVGWRSVNDGTPTDHHNYPGGAICAACHQRPCIC